MSEKQEEVLETSVEEQEQTTEQPVEEVKPDTGATVADDGTIKLDLGKLNKPQEDAVQEQSTDEIPVRNESETSEEVSEENQTESEESTEQSEETSSEEENKEEKVEEPVEVKEEIVEESGPQGPDYSQYNDLIDLLEKDDYLSKAVNYYKDNGDLKPFLEAFQYDYD